jgi:hypothetical protein
MFDKDTDYVNNWMEAAMLLAADCLHQGYSEEMTIKMLQDNCGVPDDALSLILSAGKMLYVDEMAGE